MSMNGGNLASLGALTICSCSRCPCCGGLVRNSSAPGIYYQGLGSQHQNMMPDNNQAAAWSGSMQHANQENR